jgi:predicted aminopeptidase
MWKKLSLAILFIIISLAIWQYELVSYGLMQARGQWNITFNAQPIQEILADVDFPDSLKNKLLLIREIKKFAIDSLGLNASGSYEKFYDQGGKPILWTITACEPYRLVAKEWEFPLIGKFSYKGFFDKEKLKIEENALIAQGFDTEIDEVSAWSTLGYLNDPVLSSMLKRKEGSLANLIIHELTHGTLFIDDDLTYNENLANFVGNQGAIRFLRYKYGEGSPELKTYLAHQSDRTKMNHFLLQSAKKLDSLYQTWSENTPIEEKKQGKDKMISHIVHALDTVSFEGGAYKDYFKDYRPNNAFFIGFLTYNEKQNAFEEEFREVFKGDFKRYFAYLKEKYGD